MSDSARIFARDDTDAASPIDLAERGRLVPYISRTRIADAVAHVAGRIDANTVDSSPLLIGVLKGALPFLADLSRVLKTPHQIDFMRVRSYGEDTKSGGTVELIVPPSEALEGRDVIVVEDILDSGQTYAFILEELTRRGAGRLRMAMLLRRRGCPIEPDYMGIEIDNGFVVGYGMDLAEDYRHLPDLYRFEPR